MAPPSRRRFFALLAAGTLALATRPAHAAVAAQSRELRFSHLHTGEVLTVMADLAAQGQTMIVVTHEMGFAKHVGHRLLFMDRGVIVEDGKPEDVLSNPQHTRTQQFLSKVLHTS